MIEITGTMYFIAILLTAFAYGVTGLSIEFDGKKNWVATSILCLIVGCFWPVTLLIWVILGVLTGFRNTLE